MTASSAPSDQPANAPMEDPPPKTRSARRVFGATTLGLEAFVLFFAMLVAHGLGDLPRVALWTVGSSIALACILIAGLLPRPWAYIGGWVLQAIVLVMAIWMPVLLLIGAVFAIIWWVGERTGKRIDDERAERQREASDSGR